MKQVQVTEDDVRLIVSALKRVVVRQDEEKRVWDLIEKLEQELDRQT